MARPQYVLKALQATYAGNEARLHLALPVVDDGTGSLQAARHADWSITEGRNVLPVHGSDLEGGSVVPAPQGLNIREGTVGAVMGPRFMQAVAKIRPALASESERLESGFRVLLLTAAEYAELRIQVSEEAKAVFDNAISSRGLQVGAGPERAAQAALCVLKGVHAGSRGDAVVLRELVLARLFAPGERYTRLVALHSSITGIEPKRLDALAALFYDSLAETRVFARSAARVAKLLRTLKPADPLLTRLGLDRVPSSRAKSFAERYDPERVQPLEIRPGPLKVLPPRAVYSSRRPAEKTVEPLLEPFRKSVPEA